MKLRPRVAAVAVAVAAALSPLGPVASTPAHADRCQPEELGTGPNSSPVDERDNPVCTVLFNYVYPFICSQSGNQPPPTLPQCLQNVRLNPGYRPPVVPPYSPNVNRAFCNLYYVAFPFGWCYSATYNDTTTLRIVTDQAVFELPVAVAR